MKKNVGIKFFIPRKFYKFLLAQLYAEQMMAAQRAASRGPSPTHNIPVAGYYQLKSQMLQILI